MPPPLHGTGTLSSRFFLPASLAIAAAVIFGINLYGLELGISIVLPHLFYLPIVVAAYYYPRRGVVFTAVISGMYLAMVFLLGKPEPDVFIAALARAAVFVAVAAVVSYLSGKLRNRTEMCRRLVSVVESSDDAIIGMDPQGLITDWNAGAERLYGYTAGEATGRPVSMLLPPGRPDDIAAYLESVRRGERVERYETERARKDGRIIHVSLSVSPILSEGGEVTGVSTINHDITVQRTLRDEILLANKEWEMTFSAVPDMIAVISNDYRILRVNSAMAERLGVTPANAIGKSCHELVHGLPHPLPGCPHALMLQCGARQTAELHEEQLHGDFIVTASPFSDKDGACMGSVHVMHDITERKQAEKALQEANRKLQMLSSITRHDILNQLLILRGYLEILRSDEKNPGNAAYLEKIDNAAETVTRQIEFTRFYQNIGVQAPKWHNLAATIRSAAAQIDRLGIDLDIDVTDTEVYADPLIEKVFYNLIENSLRHGGGVHRISFLFPAGNGGATLLYRDDGTGIPPEFRDSLFSRGSGKHTGFGLFLSREILSITGMTIRETGTAGTGACFEIIVPQGNYRKAQPAGPDTETAALTDR
ncbi:MAG: PAS domain S-box protein [Methanoregulaceae archaeon]|nr:PAS domain S-box protein [Methanoregulaceae archaeon]